MIHIFFFLVDFLGYCLLGRWVIRSLLVYLLLRCGGMNNIDGISLVSLFLLLLQDSFMYGRFLFGMSYIGLMLLLLMLLRRFCDIRSVILSGAALIFGFIVESFFVKNVIFLGGGGWHSTILKIIVNLLLLMLISIGTRGNRSASLSGLVGRKVWTPNRMDAS
jgi:hypothetical protein